MKLNYTSTSSSSGNTYTFTVSATKAIYGLIIIGFVSYNSPYGPCDISIGIANSYSQSYFSYKSISYSTKAISSCSVSISDSTHFTISVTSNGNKIELGYISHISLID